MNYLNKVVTPSDENCSLIVFICQYVIIVEYRLPWWDVLVQLLVLHHSDCPLSVDAAPTL